MILKLLLLKHQCIIFSAIAFFAKSAVASTGDRSQYYRHCLEKCYTNSCKSDGHFIEKPSFALQLMQWNCRDDCSYTCMWKTVQFFTTHGLQVPQFHGKWPFIRLFGLQEPASVLFSILNLCAHIRMYIKFKKSINKTTPMFYVWTYFTIVCVNGWFWSSVFHARDKQFTEIMDYGSAFAIVLTLLYCLLMRIFYKEYSYFKVYAIITCGYISILYRHISYLCSGKINYEYNMKFNIIIGFITFIITMIWWYQNYKKIPHVHFVGWFTVLTVVVTLLEVADFPPLFWIIDAHSLWHASTIPLVSLLYRFIISDCTHLKNYSLKLDEHMK